MIFLLEFLEGVPWVCFAIGTFSTMGLCLTICGYGMYLCEPKEASSMELCGKWVVFFGILLALCICIGFCAPRTEIVAMQWTNEQVSQGKMTTEQRTEFLSKYKSKEERSQ